MDFAKKENDRRSKSRFAIERDVRYKLAEDGVVVAAGSGQTIDMCSGGVAFVAEQPLTPGGFVELSISWPVLLEKSCPMQLSVLGKVLRSEGRRSVCSVDKYEFRTQARLLRNVQPMRNATVLQRWADGARRETLKAAGF